MKKNIFTTVATLLVAISSVFTFSSCSDEVRKAMDPIIETKEVEVPVLIEKDKVVYINANYNSLFDGKNLTFNGKTIMSLNVEHQKAVIEMATAEHKAAGIVTTDGMTWSDSNGQTTEATMNFFNKSNDYELMASIVPAKTYSTITRLHKKISQVTCYYNFTGNLKIFAAEGETIDNPIDFTLQRSYLMADPTIDYEIIRDTTIVIQKDTVIEERNVTVTDTLKVPEPYAVEVKVPVISNVYWNGEDILVNDLVAATADVQHSKEIIEMAANKHAAAKVTKTDGLKWTDSNGQLTTGILDIFKSSDGSYEVTGSLKPAKNYSNITKLHDKVSVVKTFYTFAGTVKVMVEGKQQKKDFSFDLVRSYFLVDPSIDIKEVHDSIIIVERDTIVNNIHTTDTLYISVDRFIRGADINTSVVNDFGVANAAITMGEKNILSVELSQEQLMLTVTDEKVLGNVSFSGISALKWNGTDKQNTVATVSANGTTPTITYTRTEYKVIATGSMVLVKPIYTVSGSFKNENGDNIDYCFEMSASYMQTYEKPQPAVVTPTFSYVVEPTTKDKESDGIKSRKLTVKITKSDQDGNVVATWKAMANIVISGAVAGYDLYVHSPEITSTEYTDQEMTEGDYCYTRHLSGNENFVETKSTHVWRYKNHWRADVGGDVYTDSQILYQSSVITFSDDEYSWSSEELGSLKKDVRIIYDKIDNDEDMQGKTRDENGMHYVYGGTHRLTVQNILNGEPWHSSTAVSPLWVVK